MEHRCFRVANGALETPLGIIRDVSVTVGDLTTSLDATVCAAETTDILLGVKFLAQVDGVLRINPPVLEMTNSQLQRCSAVVDYSGASRLHQFAYTSEDFQRPLPEQNSQSPSEEARSQADSSEEEYSLGLEIYNSSFIMSSSEDDAQLQYSSDSESRLMRPHVDYVLGAMDYAATGSLACRSDKPYHQRDVSDWMFRPDLFRAIDAKFGPFNWDACADEYGHNAQLPNFWAADHGQLRLHTGCLANDWAGKAVWCNPDFYQIDEVLAHYKRCYQCSPSTTKALFILPDWPGTSWFGECGKIQTSSSSHTTPLAAISSRHQAAPAAAREGTWVLLGGV